MIINSNVLYCGGNNPNQNTAQMKTFKYMSQPFEANYKALDHVNCPGSIFDGSISKDVAEYKSFVMKGEWHGVDSWRSIIEDKEGKTVADQISFTHYNGSTSVLWSVNDDAPKWMKEHDELKYAQSENDRLHDEEYATEMAVHEEMFELESIQDRYKGTRLFKHLANMGKSHLACWAK